MLVFGRVIPKPFPGVTKNQPRIFLKPPPSPRAWDSAPDSLKVFATEGFHSSKRHAVLVGIELEVYKLTPPKINMVHLRNTGPLEEENHLNQTINLRFYVNLRGCIWSYMHMWTVVNYCKMASRRGLQIKNGQILQMWKCSKYSLSVGMDITWTTIYSRYSIYVHPQNHINHKPQNPKTYSQPSAISPKKSLCFHWSHWSPWFPFLPSDW